MYVIALIDNNGTIVVQYWYDAWGNHKVVDEKGDEITDQTNIGNLNPFRYRGYYYDTETGLYFLQTRYYDPEVGRFLNRDSVQYADPETINGLNLYAYCLNNPVEYVDPTGNIAIALLISLLLLGAGSVAGGVINGVSSYNKGLRGWDLFKDIFLGAGMGLAIAGASIVLFSVGAGALGYLTILGYETVKLFAIGAAAFNFTAFFIAPLYGIDMEGIEYEQNPHIPNNYQPAPIGGIRSNFKYKKNNTSRNKIRQSQNNNLLRILELL